MILIDPDLEPAPRPRAKAAVTRAASGRSKLPWAERIPSPQTLRRFLSEAQEAVRLRGEVTVLLTTDATLCDLNARFRGKNKPTDVLSFPASNMVQSREKGDLAISVETARRQAAAIGHSLGIELKILILHGLLHLAGYDHEVDAGQMERRERRLRAKLGLPMGLIERAGNKSTGQRAGRSARRRKP